MKSRYNIRLVASFLICIVFFFSLALAAAAPIDLTSLQSKSGFSYDDSSVNDWTYYSYGSTAGTNGELVDFMIVSWGKNNALIDHPEIRFFITDASGNKLTAQKATLMIDKNMFEIDLSALSMDDVIGSFVPLVWQDNSLIRSLAVNNGCQMVLEGDGFTVQADWSKADLVEIKSYAADMVQYDFVNAVDTGNPTDNLLSQLDESSITAHIFEEVDENTILNTGLSDIEKAYAELNAGNDQTKGSNDSMLETKNTAGLALNESDKGKEKWGYMDKNGNLMIYPQYDYVSPFSGDRARVFLGSIDFMGYPGEGKFGYIDRNGEIVIPVSFDHADDFNQFGQAVVEKDGKYGVINTMGETVIPFEYANISFSSLNDIYLAYTEDILSCCVDKKDIVGPIYNIVFSSAPNSSVSPIWSENEKPEKTDVEDISSVKNQNNIYSSKRVVNEKYEVPLISSMFYFDSDWKSVTEKNDYYEIEKSGSYTITLKTNRQNFAPGIFYVGVYCDNEEAGKKYLEGRNIRIDDIIVDGKHIEFEKNCTLVFDDKTYSLIANIYNPLSPEDSDLDLYSYWDGEIKPADFIIVDPDDISSFNSMTVTFTYGKFVK